MAIGRSWEEGCKWMWIEQKKPSSVETRHGASLQIGNHQPLS
ncbi:MAG: hypothetical protein ACOC0N_05035 [Chroococcales cyanobacterium]